MSQIWLSKADFTWLIVISHRYVLGFTLWSQVTHSISHDIAVAHHLLVVISLCFDMTHVCGHMMYDFRTWLIVMSHGFHAWDPFRAYDLFYECDWFWYAAQLTHRSQLMDFILWLTMSHESCDAEYESHRIRVRGGLGYIRRPSCTV